MTLKEQLRQITTQAHKDQLIAQEQARVLAAKTKKESSERYARGLCMSLPADLRATAKTGAFCHRIIIGRDFDINIIKADLEDFNQRNNLWMSLWQDSHGRGLDFSWK